MTNEALRPILPIAGWPEERVNEVEITGPADPVLPTPFRITETGTAALAAVGLAAVRPVGAAHRPRARRSRSTAAGRRRRCAAART